MAQTIISLTPRDGLFLKDGRGWFTSESGRAGVVDWPFAGTVRGALRAGLGHAAEERNGRPLGSGDWPKLNPLLGVDAVLPLCCRLGAAPSAADRMWPAPRDAVIFIGDEHVTRLLPSAGVGHTGDGIIPLDDDAETVAVEQLQHPSPGDVVGKPAPMPSWWCDEAFTAWLCGLPLKAAALDRGGSPVSRVQTHVTIDPTSGAAFDGGLFSSTVVEHLTRSTNNDAAYAWEIAAIGSGFKAEELANRRVRVGGDGRVATCSPVAAEVFAMPAPLRSTFVSGSRGLRMVTVSHTSFAHGWLPGWLEAHDGTFSGDMPGVGRVVLKAACVGRPVHVSGWDMAAGQPKPTRRLVPAGSVYFFEKADGSGFTATDAEHLWLRAIGESTTPGEATGAVVPGVWKPA